MRESSDTRKYGVFMYILNKQEIVDMRSLGRYFD